MTIDDGEFTEECTNFPYTVVVKDATDDVQWTADITATRDGSSSSVTGMSTDFGSGTFGDALLVCSGDGAGVWSATVRVRFSDTTDTTKVYNRSFTLDFTVSKAVSETTITRVKVASGETKVKGTVLTMTGLSDPTMFGDVTIKVKKSGGSWKNKGTTQVDADGNFKLAIGTEYAAGTKVKAVFAGTDEAKSSTSAVWTI